MAAAVIPLVVSAIPLLKPIAISLIQHVQHLFGAKTGATKFDIVFQALTKTATELSTAGKIPGVLDPASIATIIETLVQELKSSGSLPAEPVVGSIPSIPNPSVPSNIGSISLPWGGSGFSVSVQANTIKIQPV